MTASVPHRALALTLLLIAACAVPARAQTAVAAPPNNATSPTASAAPRTEAEVRKIDKSLGRLTLKHGRIENLDMAGMTMAFKVADPAWLERLQVGDKLRVTVESVEGALTVTAIEPLR